jgi:hypothetical protein
VVLGDTDRDRRLFLEGREEPRIVVEAGLLEEADVEILDQTAQTDGLIGPTASRIAFIRM